MQDSVDTTAANGQKTTGAPVDEKKDTKASPASSPDQKGENTVPAPSLQELVRGAAEFGWLVAELLGRSFLLLEETSNEQDPDTLKDTAWDGKALVMLQGLLTPREKMRALTSHMCYLAEMLGIGSMCTIDHEGDPYENKPYAQAVTDAVKKLCKGQFVGQETFETVRGSINERLFFWDLKINDILQEKPAVIYRAYLVGYCLGGLRWWYGLPGFKLDSTFKAKALEYLPVLGPYLPQFAAPGLVRSVGPWWDALETQALAAASAPVSGGQQTAILTPADLQAQIDMLQPQINGLRTGNVAPADLQKPIAALQTQLTALQAQVQKQNGVAAPATVQTQSGGAAPVDAQKQIADLQTQVDALQKQVDMWQSDGLAPADLQKQGHIWYSLIAGECDALSYVDPTIRNRPYIWQVFLAAWPFFVISILILLLIIAALVYVIVIYKNQIVQGVAALVAAVAATWIGQTVQKNAGSLLQSALSDAQATIKGSYTAVEGSYSAIKGSYLDKVWNAALQEAVNKAIFVQPSFAAVKK
jgi:hypothetical protein